MKISEASSQKIKNMSLLCAILVVSIHVQWPSEQVLSLGWFINGTLPSGVAGIAVPFFFVISGYFLAQHFDEDGWWGREVKKRLKSLVIPFYLWIILSCIGDTSLSIMADIIAHRSFGTSIYWIHNFNVFSFLGLDFTRGPIVGQLWYVRSLFVFVLLSGVFKKGVERLGLLWIALAALIYFCGGHIPNETVRDVLTMGMTYSGVHTGIFFFSIGLYIQRHWSRQLNRVTAATCGIAGVVLLVLKLTFSYNAWPCEIIIGKVFRILFLYFIWHFMTTKKIPDWLTACSFPIFLMHTIVRSMVSVVLNNVPIGFNDLTRTFIIFFVSVTGPIAITLILRRFTPGAASLFFGGR